MPIISYSNNDKENKKLQNTIANTVIGLLSKSINKKTKSKTFTDLETARHYQVKYGDDITEIKQYQEDKIETFNPLDSGIDNVMSSTTSNRKFTDNKLFILTQSVSADLHNGFLFIAELVLQHHNLFIWHSIEKLT